MKYIKYSQKPITFFRQVAALVENPELLEYRDWLSQKYPLDAIQRAEQILNFCDGNIGAYSHSQGIPSIRKNVAKFISERDGYNADPNNIFLTAGIIHIDN